MTAGHYYNGRVSKCFDARLRFDGELVSIEIDDADELPPTPVPVRALDVTSRLEGVPRSVRFPGGELFRTRSNDEIDLLLSAAGFEFEQTYVYKLERNYQFVALALVLMAACCGAFLRWGVPIVADYAIRFVPTEVEATIGQKVLDSFSRNNLLAASDLPEGRQTEIIDYLGSYEKDANIIIKRSDFLGANAFALPGGTIILTDAFVALTRADEELLAVYLHEVGHIRKRHAVRQALRGSLISLFFVTMSGGLSAATDLTTVVPATILTLSYSREFEREADQYAIDKLIENDVAPIHFYDVMMRLTEVKYSKKNRSTVSRYLSTHPAPKERLDYIDGWQHIYESMKAQKKLDAYRGEVVRDARPACCTKSPLDAAKATSPH